MLNHEASNHEYFEELCSLAASAQISEPEFVELQDHLQECVDCRSAYADFIDLFHNKLPLAGPEVVAPSTRSHFFSEFPSSRERFLARARRQGLAVLNGPKRQKLWRRFTIWTRPGFGYAQVATLAVAALLVVVGLLAYNLHQSGLQYRKLAADSAAMSKSSGPLANPKGVGGPTSP